MFYGGRHPATKVELLFPRRVTNAALKEALEEGAVRKTTFLQTLRGGHVRDERSKARGPEATDGGAGRGRTGDPW